MEKKLEAARNIRFALVSVGVDTDIASHQGFELVADFTSTPFHEGSDFHNEYIRDQFSGLVASGHAYQSGVNYMGTALDGEKVILGIVGQEQSLWAYLRDHPTPADW